MNNILTIICNNTIELVQYRHSLHDERQIAIILSLPAPTPTHLTVTVKKKIVKLKVFENIVDFSIVYFDDNKIFIFSR